MKRSSARAVRWRQELILRACVVVVVVVTWDEGWRSSIRTRKGKGDRSLMRRASLKPESRRMSCSCAVHVVPSGRGWRRENKLERCTCQQQEQRGAVSNLVVSRSDQTVGASTAFGTIRKVKQAGAKSHHMPQGHTLCQSISGACLEYISSEASACVWCVYVRARSRQRNISAKIDVLERSQRGDQTHLSLSLPASLLRLQYCRSDSSESDVLYATPGSVFHQSLRFELLPTCRPARPLSS